MENDELNRWNNYLRNQLVRFDKFVEICERRIGWVMVTIGFLLWVLLEIFSNRVIDSDIIKDTLLLYALLGFSLSQIVGLSSMKIIKLLSNRQKIVDPMKIEDISTQIYFGTGLRITFILAFLFSGNMDAFAIIIFVILALDTLVMFFLISAILHPEIRARANQSSLVGRLFLEDSPIYKVSLGITILLILILSGLSIVTRFEVIVTINSIEISLILLAIVCLVGGLLIWMKGYIVYSSRVSRIDQLIRLLLIHPDLSEDRITELLDEILETNHNRLRLVLLGNNSDESPVGNEQESTE